MRYQLRGVRESKPPVEMSEVYSEVSLCPTELVQERLEISLPESREDQILSLSFPPSRVSK